MPHMHDPHDPQLRNIGRVETLVQPIEPLLLPLLWRRAWENVVWVEACLSWRARDATATVYA